MNHLVKSFGVLFLAILFAGGSANGQKVSGNISGLVTDPSGMGVPGAEVTVLNDGTGVPTNVTTTSTGFYLATGLIPGTYTVTVKAKGFEEFKSTNNVLNVDSVLRVDCALRVGKMTEVVTVTSTAAVLKTDRADVSDVLSGETLHELPIINNNVSDLIQINPGTLLGGGTWPGENPGADHNGFVNGLGGINNAHQLNGIDDEETIQGDGMVLPPIDSLQEIKITMNAYDAQYGQVNGAVFEASTKAGSNRYHGTMFEYVQNNDMFARDPFTQSTIGNAPWRWNQFGGSMGGPIKKDKLFFFSDYQGMRSRQGSTMLLSLPTAAMRQGDFSSLSSLYPIYDPTTGDINGNGRTQFAYGGTPNVIPPASLNASAQDMVALLPLPNVASPPAPYLNNYDVSGSFISDTDEIDPRIDYNLNQNTRMFGVYTFMRSIYDAPGVFGLVLGGPGFGPQTEYGGTRTQVLSYTITHNFGATMIGDFRFGFSRFRAYLPEQDINLTTASKFGLGGINIGTTDTNGLPEFSWGGPVVNNYYVGYPFANFYELEQQATYSTNWTKIIGSHTLKWGAELRPKASLRRIDKSLVGAYGFGQYTTGISTNPDSGIGFASFLLGDPNSFSRGAYLRLPQEYQDRHALYVQDSWRVNKKLSVNYGVRWEYFSPTYSTGTGGEVNFDFATANMVFAGIGPYNKYAGVQPRYDQFGPRVGIAYMITPATVFRIGYARSYFVNAYGANFGTYCCQWPIGNNQAITSTTAYNTLPFTLAQGPPSATVVNPVIPSNGALLPPPGEFVMGKSFDDPTSGTDSWNGTLEHQFTPSLKASIAYVGNVGRHLWYPNVPNAPVPGPGPFCPRMLWCTTYGITGYVNSRNDNGNSDFNSMQVQVDKKFTHGYQFRAAYTWQRTISDSWQDPFDREAYTNLNGPPQWLTLSHVLDLPFGPGHFIGGKTQGVAGQVIGGWRLSGIWQFQAGDRLSVGMNENTLNSEWISQMPNCSGNPNISNPSVNNWFNDSVFSVPALYQFGTCGLTTIKGPRWWNNSLRLEKSFRLREGMHLDFRWDWYNAFNLAELGNPDTTFDDPASAVGHIFDVRNSMRRTQLGLHLYF
jgi:hypothetical protein